MILIVDDEELVSSVYCDFLRFEGYQVEVAVSVAEARKKLTSESFELVITDYKMPSEDGLELIRYMNAEFPEIKVVMITGFPERNATNEAFRQGIVEFLYKPVECEELLYTVKKLLSKELKAFMNNEDSAVDEILKELKDVR